MIAITKLVITCLIVLCVQAQKLITIDISWVEHDYPITKTQRIYDEAHKKRLRSSSLNANLTDSIIVDLKNTNNNSYAGPLFFGTPLQGSKSGKFIYDTGSGWLTVTSKDCKFCITKYYN